MVYSSGLNSLIDAKLYLSSNILGVLASYSFSSQVDDEFKILTLMLLINQLEPLTEQQLVGICNLQHSSQQAEDALSQGMDTLSQGMDALQQSLAETLAGSLARPHE